jgi:hypothetical protein
MRFLSIAAASFTVLASIMGSTSAQNVLPTSEVPNVGGGVYKASDPALSSYTFKYNPPFTPSNYDGYYKYAVNNETVSISNLTNIGAPSTNGVSATGVKYPFWEVSEGTPKQITRKSDSAHCKGHGKRWRSKCNGVDKFKKILHVMFENEVYDWTMGDPWWKLLATRGKLLTNSHGITHPSLPNYVAITAGDFFGIANEDWYNVNATTIYDLLDDAGLSYATYSEIYTPVATSRGPNDCNNAQTLGAWDSTVPGWGSPAYRRLDVPALSFSTYTTSYTRCSKVYNATAKFDADVKSHNLPVYSFYVPDMLHNGHDPESDSDYAHQSTTSGIWLNAFLDMYLEELTAQGTLVVVTWDEATWQNDNDYVPNNDNHIATILFGHGITPNTKDNSYFTHYGALRGVITNFGLGSLGRNDTNATNGDLTYFVN